MRASGSAAREILVTIPSAERIILALDVPDADAAEHLADRVGDRLAFVKIGLQLFTASGPEIVSRMQMRGLRTFVDLKLHDIPRTVASAVTSLENLGADFLTIHLCGGPVMVRAAVDASRSSHLLGVTVLTSIDSGQLHALGIAQEPAARVLSLAEMGVHSGVPGLVASPREVGRLRKVLGPSVTIVTPGVRPDGEAANDQKRTATPFQAVRDGADYLVVGRPISGSPCPKEAFDRILEEVSSARSAG